MLAIPTRHLMHMNLSWPTSPSGSLNLWRTWNAIKMLVISSKSVWLRHSLAPLTVNISSFSIYICLRLFKRPCWFLKIKGTLLFFLWVGEWGGVFCMKAETWVATVENASGLMRCSLVEKQKSICILTGNCQIWINWLCLSSLKFLKPTSNYCFLWILIWWFM